MSTLSRQNWQGLRLPPPAGPFLSRRRDVCCRPRAFATRTRSYLSISERNVVVRGGRGSPCEVAGVGRNVGLRREAAAVLGTLAGSQELDGIGNDIHCLALVPVLVLPLAPLEAAVERDRAPLRQVVGAVLALRAPHRDVEVVGLVDPVARAILAAGV